MFAGKSVIFSSLSFALVCASGFVFFRATTHGSTLDQQSAAAGIQYLANAMDQFHNRFPVYDDVSSAGNHFHTLTKFPSASALVTINGSYSLDKHSGATSIRCTFTPGGGNFGGYNFQNGVLPNGAVAPVPNFGTEPNAGYNLSGATTLTFWARGQQGGETVDFFMGGVGWDENTRISPFPDSTSAVKITALLTTHWTQYTIDLTGKDISYVLGGFSWGVDGALNPAGAVFYLDDIQYNLNAARLSQRLNEPRFIRSFTTLPSQPSMPTCTPGDGDFDLAFRGGAFLYDNTLAALAFLAEGGDDSLRRARLIGDAIVYATEHDRKFSDGRLRSVYAAGDIALPPGWTPNDRAGTVPVAGYYIDVSQQFCELGESRHFDTGNNAWAMIALLALHRRTGDVRYLNAAQTIGNFIRTFRNNAGTYQGFQGGLEYRNGDNNQPFNRDYASTEHNLDVFAAFTVMRGLTGESVWQTDAQHAQQFVEAMWDSVKGCYLTGTNNPDERNTNSDQLPVDVQAWSVLALPNTLTLHPQALDCAEVNHQTAHDGFSGFDFNNDKDGVWFEGTAQMAVAYAWANQLTQAASSLQELRRAQTTLPFGDGFGISAACHDGVTTGFGFKLFRRLHVGATAWLVFAESGFNPYYFVKAAPICQTTILPFSQSFNGDGGGDSVSVIAGGGCGWQAISQANWITITSGSSGAGNGTVSYSVAANNGPARTGTMTIAGQIFTVTQAACAYSINPASQSFPISGGTGTVTVTTTAGCPWTATSNAPWLTTGSSGAGNGTASYSVAANTGPARTGTMTIAGQTFTVNQFGVALQYYPLPRPIRLFDTRAPIPGFAACEYLNQPLTAGGELVKQARITCDGITIPANAHAIVGNATVVSPAGAGFVTLWPDGQPRPPVSNLNYTAGQIVANAFTVGLGANGRFRIYSSASTHFIVDVTGYFAPPGTGGLFYHPLPRPIRLFDTRAPIPGFAACAYLNQPLLADAELARQARITCDGITIPADATAIVGNATVTGATGSGFITLFPNGQPRPPVSNLNYVTGQTVPNAFTVGLGTDGQFRTYALAGTHFIVDVTGYYSPSSSDANGTGLLYNSLPRPIRLFDTRASIPGFPACEYLNQPLVAGAELAKQARVTCDGITIPAAAQAIVGNATVVGAFGNGFVTLWPNGPPRPPVSNLNYVTGQTVPNAFTVGLGADGQFRIYSLVGTHFITDVAGFYAP